ncbi:hypothetical protein HYDPIDRAFT_33638 [Hydnomerulius pinastri MD-312]|uniref:Uncharacterized protein n=1 Tax=Hydnomerulius pinastri MD-312 TaxID=994086 RepID=A0A0C9W7U0_9AGAM|nr:hypothetical protein HYDPIDRAFT_33638 [Hydnomerulius pinastri MD-312]
MCWQRFLDLAVEYGIRVTFWPKDMLTPHAQFDVKSIKSNPLRHAVFPYLTRTLGVLYDDEKADEKDSGDDDIPKIQMEVWDKAELALRDADPLKAKVPLVIATDGTHLAVVADAPDWQNARQEEDGRRQELAATRPKKPSKAKARMPQKRARVEVTEDEEDTHDQGVTIHQGQGIRSMRPAPSTQHHGRPLAPIRGPNTGPHPRLHQFPRPRHPPPAIQGQTTRPHHRQDNHAVRHQLRHQEGPAQRRQGPPQLHQVARLPQRGQPQWDPCAAYPGDAAATRYLSRAEYEGYENAYPGGSGSRYVGRSGETNDGGYEDQYAEGMYDEDGPCEEGDDYY